VTHEHHITRRHLLERQRDGAVGAVARTFVIAAREDKQIAAGVRSLWPSVSAV